MSNNLAVAMVTSAVSHILSESLADPGPGGVQNSGVTTVRPDMLSTNGNTRGVNVFLYQVTPSAPWMSDGLPTRRSDGTVVHRPQQALDLHYLLTAFGDESELEPQRLLGNAMTALTATPVLSRALIAEVIDSAVQDEANAWQQFADLAAQIDVVRMTLVPLSIDDLTKLWSSFYQSPYQLSVVYTASVVLLNADIRQEPALPVRRRFIDVFPIRVPAITRVVAASAPTDPVVPGTPIRVEGERLRSSHLTRVRVGPAEVAVAGDDLTDTAFEIPLPAGVPAGINGVQVLHLRQGPEPGDDRPGAQSNSAPLTVRPVVDGAVTSDGVSVTVPLDPPVRRTQRVTLILNEHTVSAGRAYLFAAPPFDPAGPETMSEVTVAIQGVEPGDYLVRVQVDGAESGLGVDGTGRYDSPLVTIP